jgi:VanZ family protein
MDGLEFSPASSQPAGSARLAAFVRRWSGLAVLVYLTALITGTHLPNPDALIPVTSNDKGLHFGAYFGLAFLMATRLQALRPVTWRAMLVLLGLVAMTGAVDEWTQLLPGINRQCELADWWFDVAGAAAGLCVWQVMARPLLSRNPVG